MKTDSPSNRQFTRRKFIGTAAAAALASPLARAAQGASHQATGVRVGEVTDTTAIVWTRLTKFSGRNARGVAFNEKGKGAKAQPKDAVPPADQIEGACPAMAGRVRVRYSLREDLSDAIATPWAEVSEGKDGIHQFALAGLKAGSTYHYASETAGADGVAHESLRGKFHTAPAAGTPSAIRFCVMTCQGYQDRDHADGHPIYPAMLALDPRFISLTGDLV